MKNKLVIAIFAGLLSLGVNAQNKYFTKTGNITFFSKAPLEDIEATNNKVTSILDISTGDMDFAVLIKSFKFEKALMQEHFNENYLESDKFPKASFKGKVSNISSVSIAKDGNYPVKISGKLTIHGVTNDVNATGTITVKSGAMHGTSEFKIAVSDYKIDIPGLVKDKIAKEVRVVVDCDYVLFKR